MKKTISDFVCNLSYDDLPDDVLAVMHRSLLDTIGVAAIGSQSDLSAIVLPAIINRCPPRCRQTEEYQHE